MIWLVSLSLAILNALSCGIRAIVMGNTCIVSLSVVVSLSLTVPTCCLCSIFSLSSQYPWKRSQPLNLLLYIWNSVSLAMLQQQQSALVTVS